MRSQLCVGLLCLFTLACFLQPVPVDCFSKVVYADANCTKLVSSVQNNQLNYTDTSLCQTTWFPTVYSSYSTCGPFLDNGTYYVSYSGNTYLGYIYCPN